MKQTLRQEMRERRKALSQSSYAEKSASIREKLTKHPIFEQAKKVLVYVSTDEEVDTHELIKACLERGDEVYAPKINGENLAICPIKEWDELEPGEFGILEPCTIINEAHPSEMDIILVPGLAFDRAGHRLGYGKGFYDKLLKQTKGTKIGLAFEEQLVDKIPTESHDVPLDLIITDQSLVTLRHDHSNISADKDG